MTTKLPSPDPLLGVGFDLLATLRHFVEVHDLPDSKIPPFLKGWLIQFARIRKTNYGVLWFTASGDTADTVEALGECDHDVDVFYSGVAHAPTRTLFPLSPPYKVLAAYQESEEWAPPPRVEIGEHNTITDAHIRTGGASLIMEGITFAWMRDKKTMRTVNIDMALILAPDHAQDRTFLGRLCKALTDGWGRSSATSYWPKARLHTLARQIADAKTKSCVVLGKDTGAYLAELRALRDELRNLGYDAALVKELPEIAEFGNTDKAFSVGQSARFCIVLDREPSGHIDEVSRLRSAAAILAILRQRGKGSTWMIGDDSPAKPHERVFEFDDSPHEVLKSAAKWADGCAEQLKAHYDKRYPWRTASATLSQGKILPM